MLASSWFDPVLGIDIHWEMVPMPAPVPTPIPNPFTGMIFDPAGLIGGMIMGAAMSAVFGAPFQGPVLYWGFIPSTNTGTDAKHIPGHILIPPGTIWAPVPRTPKPKIHPGEPVTPAPPIKPENDAICVFGSKTVTVGGSNAVRLGDILLSCSEPIRLPSSVVLAIPKGAPILIGGPPSLDLMAAIMASLRTRFMSDSLHALVSRLPFRRLRNVLNRAVCFFTGHPVDVASGKVMTDAMDAELPGPLPLQIERIYSSAFGGRNGPLGHGWSLSLDQAIWSERGKVVLLAEDGREIEFDTFDLPEHRMGPGDEVWHPIDRLTLKCKGNGRWQVVAHDGVTRDFAPVPGRKDSRAMVQRIRSRCGHHEIAFEYDKKGRLEWVRDACGRLVWLEHDDHGRMSALKLPLPQGQGFYTHRRYVYDDRGDLVQVIDPLDHSWRYEYVTHLLVKETDRTGLSFYFAYDGLGEDAWCVRTWGDGGVYDHKIAYEKVKKITFVTDSLGRTTQYHMNLMGQVVKVVDPLGGETTYEHDPRTLQKTAEIDPLGNAHRWEYDERGNSIRSIAADGATVSLGYDGREQLVQATDPCGGEWRWEYSSPTGLLLREIDALGGVTQYQSLQGLIRTIVDPLGARTEVEYDQQKNPCLLRDADGGETRCWYDQLGQVVRVRDARSGEQRARYDIAGRLVEIREPDGNCRELSYDGEGNLIGYRDSLREVKYGYTGLHKLAWQEEEGTRVELHYDTEDQLIGVTNEKGERYQFILDERGEVVEEIGFDGGRWKYKRDTAGRVIAETRPSGARTEMAYDATWRPILRSHSDGTKEEFGYRADGTLAWAENETGRVEFQRDALGNIVGEVQGAHTVRSRYDPQGRRQTVESSLQARASALRSPSGRLSRLIMIGPDQKAWEVQFDRDSTGAEVERRLPGGVTARWERDGAGRARVHRISVAGRPVTAREYEWQADDQLRGIVDATRGRTTYSHDRRGRLSWADLPGNRRQYRMPDPVGNLYRTSEQHDRSYGPGGRLDQANGTTYLRDPDGNLLEKRCADGSTWGYSWNGAGHLKEVVRPDGGKVAFSYDAIGRRVSKRTPEGETSFVWDGDLLLHESSPAQGSTTWHFEPGTFALVAKEQQGRRYTAVSDHLGTPTELYDEAGQLAWQMQLDTYGVGRPDVALTQCPWRWPGQYEDAETGLYYNRFRYYDPEAGQYINQDPIGLDGGFAPYAYAPDTSTWTDPLGLAGGPDFGTLMHQAQNTLDFSTPRNGAVFWSGPNMNIAQNWAQTRRPRKFTLEQTPGGKYLASLDLFNTMNPKQAAQIWDAASLRFAQGASGNVNVFSTGAKRVGPFGERTWWRIERPALRKNPNVRKITRRRKDGKPCK